MFSIPNGVDINKQNNVLANVAAKVQIEIMKYLLDNGPTIHATTWLHCNAQS